jgi:hypothetical protein
VHGRAASKEAAIALAEAMIRSGEFPSPEDAKQRRKEELERHRNRPSAIRRREERKQENKLLSVMSDAERRDHRDDDVTPFYELFADAYDLTDPNLWRSNSFALLRPRLIISVEAAIARRRKSGADVEAVEPILQLVQSRLPGGNGMINQACARAKHKMAGSAAAPAV